MPFKQELSRIAADVEKVLDEMLPRQEHSGAPTDAARYATLDAGKRLRTFLTVQAAGLFDVSYDAALRAGAVIELVHNFSLIHDDLPCIDNDTLRRGRPSVWAKYGESNAVLAGDFLLNHAYKILADDSRIAPDYLQRIMLIKALSSATNGMLLGEWMDIQAESGRFQTESEVNEIQALKTGQIFWACIRFGTILAKEKPSNEQILALDDFVDAMGLCFQITDDILDAVGDQDKVGKTLRKDAAAGASGKATYVSLYGVEGARAKARELSDRAKNALSIFDNRADNLRELMDYMVTRET
ncbi:MAG: polyprenyl synthetase family protein [Alphaproteobacteria bacterium]|nr:polyprenyl synthetase family protein [Alphaproteobacteria bacterium]